MKKEDKRLKRRVRNSYLISTVSIAMVLFLLGSVTYLILGALDITERLKESITIYVILERERTEEQTALVRQAIENKDIVREVVYVSKEDAAEELKAQSGENFSDFIDFNPLPDSFEVRLGARASEKDLIEAFVGEIETAPGVYEVDYQKGVVDQINTNLGKFELVLLFFGVALLVISLILLSNTIRMTIFAKRHTINTMKSVGANMGFIMRPFLGAAALHGLYAGLIATAMFALLIFGLQESIPEISLAASDTLMVAIAGTMIVGGVFISFLFTLLAVSRAVKQPAGKAYLL